MKLRSTVGPADAAALAFASLLAAAITYGFWGFSYDDAFITYRYADNLSRGQGLVFNPGERVLGTTAPGYAILLAFLVRMTGGLGLGIAPWGTLLSTASIAAVAALLARSLSALRAAQRAVVVALFAGLAFLLQWNVEMLGTETLPVMALVAWAARLAIDEDRSLLAGLLVAGAMFLRLDAGLGAAAIGITLWWRRGRFPRAFAVAGLAPLVPWLLGLTLYFGTPIPQTLAARRSELAFAPLSYSVAQWSWLTRSLPLVSGLLLVVVAAAGLAGLIRAGAWRRPAVVALGAWIALTELFYRVVEVPFCAWYHQASLHALLALAAYGATVLTGAVGRRASSDVAWAASATVVLLPVLWSSIGFVAEHWRRPPDPRFELYRSIGEWLRAESSPDDVVASVEIGILGYTSRRPVLDLVGLISPESLQARDHLDELVLERRPRFIVDNPGFRDEYLAPILDHPDIRRVYRLAESFADDRYPIAVHVLERISGESG